MSRLIDFYRGDGLDGSGRRLAEIWAFSDAELEAHHDFIQWLFPMRAASRFNPSAPTLTDADIHTFRADASLQTNLRRSFEVFLAFLGFRLDSGQVGPASDFEQKADLWRCPNHNWLRTTRVLTSLRTLGLKSESRAFFEALKQLRDSGDWAIHDDTFRFWESAVSG